MKRPAAHGLTLRSGPTQQVPIQLPPANRAERRAQKKRRKS